MFELAETPEEGVRLFRHMSRSFLERWPRSARASHLALCRWCKKPYLAHPPDPEYPYLNVDCDGRRLKL